MIILPTDKLLYFKDIAYLTQASYVCFCNDKPNMDTDDPLDMYYVMDDGHLVKAWDNNVVILTEGQKLPRGTFEHWIDDFEEWESYETEEDALNDIMRQFQWHKIEIVEQF